MKSKILITGTAGFIGYHVAKRFIEAGYEVAGLDSRQTVPELVEGLEGSPYTQLCKQCQTHSKIHSI